MIDSGELLTCQKVGFGMPIAVRRVEKRAAAERVNHKFRVFRNPDVHKPVF